MFDILWLDGRDVMPLPLEARRALLSNLSLPAPLHRVAPLEDPRPWTSRAPNLLQPDICVFDLDPSQEEPDVLRAVALALRDLLRELRLPSWVKTSGSKGFHIVVPLHGRDGRDQRMIRDRPADGEGRAQRMPRRPAVNPASRAGPSVGADGSLAIWWVGS